MGRFSRQELEAAIQHYRDTARKSATSGDWTHWANLFTEDVTYNEHHFGKFSAREAVYRWISSIMSAYPMDHMIYFPWTWYVVDEERGWVICELMNRMKDPGDGSLHEEPNITILHYAGNNQWSYEEDAYDFENVARMIARWQEAKDRCDELIAEGRDPRQERHLSRFGNVDQEARAGLGSGESASRGASNHGAPEYLSSPATAALELPFSEAVRVGGLLFVSGQIGNLPGKPELAPGGIRAEARQALDNIAAILERNGSSLERAVKCTVFLLDMADWPAFNEVWLSYFPNKPARSALAASGLALGARVEIECIAAAGD